MSRTPTDPTLGPPDALDRLLSDYFNSELPHPWPAPPAVGHAEPSSAVRPAYASDPNSRARWTLTCSVAVLLGSCWYFSNGWQAGHQQGSGKPAPGSAPVGINNLDPGTADASKGAPGELARERAKKGTNPMGGFTPGPMKLP